MWGRAEEQSSSAVAVGGSGGQPGGATLLREIRLLRVERSIIEAQLNAEKSRTRVAAASERKRIERNLHDGAQQRLLTVSLAMRAAQTVLHRSPSEADRIIARAMEELMLAIADLRDLAAGMRPVTLNERGLVAAVAELVQGSQVRVDVLEIPSDQLSEEMETAIYFVIAEAIANVTKHASADCAHVSITPSETALTVEVRDDGIGGASTRVQYGSGLRGLAERVGSFGGEFDVIEVVGGGTLIRAVFPIGPLRGSDNV